MMMPRCPIPNLICKPAFPPGLELTNRVMTSFTLVGDEADRVAAADVRDLEREARPTPVSLGQPHHWMSLPSRTRKRPRRSRAGDHPPQNDAFFSFTVAHVKPQAVPVISSGSTVRVKLTCSLGPPRAATWKINVRPSRIPSRTSGPRA
jgi:hypothetical protein